MPPAWRLVHYGSGQAAPTAGTQAKVLRQAGDTPLAPGEYLDVEHCVDGRWCLVGRRKAGGALLCLVLVQGAPPPAADWLDAWAEAT